MNNAKEIIDVESKEYDDLRPLVGEEEWPAFIEFISTGSASESFCARLDSDDNLQKAVERAYEKQIQDVAGFAGALRSQVVTKKPKSGWFATSRFLVFGMAASLLVALFLGVEIYRQADQTAGLHVDFDNSQKTLIAEVLAHHDPSSHDRWARELAPMLKSQDQKEREIALAALFNLDPMSHRVNSLLSQISKDKNEEITTRLKAIGRLGKGVANPKTVETLFALMGSNNKMIQKHCAKAFAELAKTPNGGHFVIAELKKQMSSNNETIRRWAAESLVLINVAESIRPIEHLIPDERRDINELENENTNGKGPMNSHFEL